MFHVFTIALHLKIASCGLIFGFSSQQQKTLQSAPPLMPLPPPPPLRTFPDTTPPHFGTILTTKKYHDRERDGQGKGKRQEEALWHFVDNPALDGVKPYVEDLYLANARPRIETNSVCFRRQRENASTAAGALTNTLGGIDLWTNQPPRPMDKAGEDRIELLEVGARMLIR